MKKKTIIKMITMILLLLASSLSCKKQDDWLDVKTRKSDVVPETLADFQAILDNSREMNAKSFLETGLLASDNIQVSDEQIPEMGEQEENVYFWRDKVWLSEISFAWDNCYKPIEFANLVLDGIKSLPDNNAAYNSVKGQALFFRAAALYNLAQTFCKPYVESTAAGDQGLPIRETSDVNIIIRKRSTLKETYEKILSDLQLALSLLPERQPYFQRPTVSAVNGYLAKVYLTMENYPNAAKYANAALQSKSDLLDFNSGLISTTATYPFPLNGVGNPEIIFYATCSSYLSTTPEAFGSSVGFIPGELFSLYDDNDLRKSVFFANRNGVIRLIGTYAGTFSNFSGIATNELFLIRAEVAARAGNIQDAMADINHLLIKRYKTGTYQSKTASDGEQALKIVLTERRKELPFTGNIRWEDLRRLNHDPRFQKTLTRVSGGKTYTLPPNDKKYVFPIPENEIVLSGIPQNDR